MSEYPPVPIPPTDLSAPFGPSVMFLVICAVLLGTALVYTCRGLAKGRTLGLLLILGGLLAGCLEAPLDYQGLLWFADDDAVVAVTTYHRFIPLYVVFGYAFYFGAQAYVGYKAVLCGKPVGWFWKFYAADFLFDFSLQAIGHSFGLYQYYGNQPFMFLGVPLWWIAMDSVLPALSGLVLFSIRHRLYGWRALIVIPLVPALYGGQNMAFGWPIFSALNSDVPTAVVWLAGAATISLAWVFHGVILDGIQRAQRNAGIAERPLDLIDDRLETFLPSERAAGAATTTMPGPA